MDMRAALEEALQTFNGAMVLVTHDRHLVATTCDRLWLVANGQCTPFDGDLDDYARWLLSSASKTGGANPPEAAAPKRSAADTRDLRNQLKRLERDMQRTSARIEAIEAQLSDPTLYEGGQQDRITELGREQEALRTQLAEAEAAWLEAAEALEEA